MEDEGGFFYLRVQRTKMGEGFFDLRGRRVKMERAGFSIFRLRRSKMGGFFVLPSRKMEDTPIFAEPPIFEEPHSQLRRTPNLRRTPSILEEPPPSSKNPPYLRSSEPMIEEPPSIYDLRGRRTKNSPPSSIFDFRPRRSKNLPHLRFSAPKNGLKIGRNTGGEGATSSKINGGAFEDGGVLRSFGSDERRTPSLFDLRARKNEEPAHLLLSRSEEQRTPSLLLLLLLPTLPKITLARSSEG